MENPNNYPMPFQDAPPMVHDKIGSLLHGPPGLLLDVPAGTGAFAERAKALGYEVYGGDLEADVFRVEGIECKKMDLNQPWPFDDKAFNYVVSIEGVEHLENPWHLVREANRVLKPGGFFLVTTPNVLSLKSRLSYLFNGYPNYFHYMVQQDELDQEEGQLDHINPIGFLELRHVLARSGFCVDRIETNRYLKEKSWVLQVLRWFLHSRGRRHTKSHEAKKAVREILLSPTLLFGEVLILRAQKKVD